MTGNATRTLYNHAWNNRDPYTQRTQFLSIKNVQTILSLYTNADLFVLAYSSFGLPVLGLYLQGPSRTLPGNYQGLFRLKTPYAAASVMQIDSQLYAILVAESDAYSRMVIHYVQVNSSDTAVDRVVQSIDLNIWEIFIDE
jgi:hypothetical protein